MPEEPRFQTTTSTVIRGLEKRTIAKRQSEGWELVSEAPGALRTELTFRRPKPKTPWLLFAGVGAGAAVLAGVIAIGTALGGVGDEGASSSQAASTASAAPRTTEAPEPSAETTVEPKPSDDVETPLTAETNADLAELLTGPGEGPDVEQFAAEYAGRIIEFDGSIGAMARHGDYETRFDILISYGDYSETVTAGGPSFQFRDVNTTFDLHYVGDVPDGIGVGDNLRVTARVIEYDAFRNLFMLEPVATEFR